MSRFKDELIYKYNKIIFKPDRIDRLVEIYNINMNNTNILNNILS